MGNFEKPLIESFKISNIYLRNLISFCPIINCINFIGVLFGKLFEFEGEIWAMLFLKFVMKCVRAESYLAI